MKIPHQLAFTGTGTIARLFTVAASPPPDYADWSTGTFTGGATIPADYFLRL